VLCTPPRSIDVVDQHVHDGSVDLHSGHLHMQGSLLVKGDVSSTFRVYASGDVEIRGGVDNGSVYAGGNVRIHRGVRGGPGTSVCAEGDLSVKYAESASLYAGRLLQIGQAVHATLAASRVEISGKLHGGQTFAELGAIVREAGSPGGMTTEIAVAEPLELPLEAAKRELERAKAARAVRASKTSRGGPADRLKGGKLGRADAVLQQSETRRLAERARRRKELCAAAFVQLGVAHPGVSVRIGDQTLQIEQHTPGSRISLDPLTRKLRVDRLPS
jgi:hypothetical protein